ncbi:unnamed protein product [Candida verbasci]|uniref:Uncharacterized protein n=1 Tax=Candida verbasci TaxID=1227364 RepID=A0A9W4U248_9ASCO|nr:unnamed protein product [Candida verbasci]
MLLKQQSIIEDKESNNSIPDNLLTPNNCISPIRIKRFLEYSRHLTDDSIKPHLNEISLKNCQSYFENEIIPQWKLRSQVLHYCKDFTNNLKHTDEQIKLDYNQFDLRTNPYAYKDYQKSQNEKNELYNNITRWVKNEETIENIIRDQTIQVLNDKCLYQDWFKLFKKIAYNNE